MEAKEEELQMMEILLVVMPKRKTLITLVWKTVTIQVKGMKGQRV